MATLKTNVYVELWLMEGIWVLTAENVLRLEEKPFEILRGIISFSPLFSATLLPPFIPFSPVPPALLSPLKHGTK
jgi:hypothetical protein